MRDGVVLALILMIIVSFSVHSTSTGATTAADDPQPSSTVKCVWARYAICDQEEAQVCLYPKGSDFVSNAIHDGKMHEDGTCDVVSYLQKKGQSENAPSVRYNGNHRLPWFHLEQDSRMSRTRRRPSIFLDVGANVGTWGIAIAKMVPWVKIIMVEAHPDNAAMIRQTISANGLDDRARVYNRAVTHTRGKDMCVWRTNDRVNKGNARLVPYFDGVRDFGSDRGKRCEERVKSITLNQLYTRIGQPYVEVLKIDIEGYETLALLGGSMIFEVPPKRVYFEYQRAVTEESGADKGMLFDIFHTYGYTVYQLVGEAKIQIKSREALPGIFNGLALQDND